MIIFEEQIPFDEWLFGSEEEQEEERNMMIELEMSIDAAKTQQA